MNNSSLIGLDRDEIQRRAADAALREFDRGLRSTVVQMPTQTGKTRMACGLLARTLGHRFKRALVLNDSGHILTQWGGELDRIVLPDGSVGIAYAWEKAVQEARDVMTRYPDVRVCLGSKDSLQDREGGRSRLTDYPADFFDLIIGDEIHKALAPTWQNPMNHFAGAKILGLTATIDRLDGRALGEIFESTAFVYPIRDAVRNGHRTPYWVLRCKSEIDLAGLMPWDFEDDGSGRLTSRVIPKLSDIGDDMIKYLDEYDIKRAIAFLPSVACAREFARVMTLKGYPARAVCGADYNRDEIIAAHKAGEFPLLCNQKLLGLGYSDPQIEAVLMLCPTDSRALYDQMAGRGGATHPGKEWTYLITTGWHAAHSLVGPTDIYASEMSLSRRARISKVGGDANGPLDDIFDEAEMEVEYEDLMEEEQDYIASERKLRYATERGIHPHALESFNPLGVVPDLEIAPADPMLQERPTPQQRAVLAEYGIHDVKCLTRRSADYAIQYWQDRTFKGLANPDQLRRFHQLNFLDMALPMTEAAAGKFIDRLDAAGQSALADTVVPMADDEIVRGKSFSSRSRAS